MRPHPRTVIAAVCLAAGITVAELTGTRRHPEYLRARRACVWLLRTVCKLSLPEITECMGRRKAAHSTNRDRLIEAERLMVHDAEFRAFVYGAWPSINPAVDREVFLSGREEIPRELTGEELRVAMAEESA